MSTLGNLESFLNSAELGSFSAASRKLGLSPGAVSKNVARLEASLGVLLFQRNTRQLTLTEVGESFLNEIRSGLDGLHTAINNASGGKGAASGTLKISMPYAFGMDHILPLLPGFISRYPSIVPDWSFDNKPADLIKGGFEIGIGGAIELPQGIVVRKLMDLRIVAVAAPSFLKGKALPRTASDLANYPGITMRSDQSGRLRTWVFKNESGEHHPVEQPSSVMLSDPEAMCRTAVMGLGIALVPLCQADSYIAAGSLVRLLPEWYADAGPIWIYYAGQRLLPRKSRVFIDYVVEQFELKRQTWNAKRNVELSYA